MLLQLLSVAGGATGGTGIGQPDGSPSLAFADVVSLNPGTPNVSDASVRVFWDVINPNPTLYQTEVYQEGVLVATLDNAVEFFDVLMRGYIENGPLLRRTVTWRFRVDVVRKSNGQSVASRNTSDLTITYGSSTGGI